MQNPTAQDLLLARATILASQKCVWAQTPHVTALCSSTKQLSKGLVTRIPRREREILL